MRVLITGFEAYWDYPENSSWMVAERVADHGVEDVDIVVEQMPVSFSRVASVFRLAVEKHNPDLIIMLGQSGGSDRVKLERVALISWMQKYLIMMDIFPMKNPYSQILLLHY